ncbi:MAG: SDR family NAD(P)-dependent oxidoreductase, partial [Polyangiaceae bacterium]|nr:SDR family NAD(P)-dependent oxidoreductase [Polyangiaceae bacterium]
MAIDLDGAIVCVTGGGRGIGRATAAALAARGARVFLGDIDLGVADRAAEELGGDVRALH